MHEPSRLSSLATQSFMDYVFKRVIDYVVGQQNMDGGYAFCQGVDSNTQDTYYALAILKLLDAPFPRLEKTVKWLHSFVPDSLYSHYYVAKALELIGDKPERESLKRFVLSLPIVRGDFGTVDVYAEIASEFLLVSMATELVNMIGVEVDREKIIDWLLSFKNSDGGFGAYGHSNLNSTYHALASLSNLGYPVKSLIETLDFVRACEKPYGGFTVVPNVSSPYMEHIYYGTSTLNIFDESLRYPKQTLELVLKCQNANGGFARSELGISTLENTFYAVNILKTIKEQW